MKPSSCKAKGRRLQQQVAAALQSTFGLPAEDVRSTSMGCAGEDLLLSAAARRVVPFSFECKNVEKLNLWEAWAQAEANRGAHAPALIIKRNRSDTLCVIRFESFLDLLHQTTGAAADAGPVDVDDAAGLSASAAPPVSYELPVPAPASVPVPLEAEPEAPLPPLHPGATAVQTAAWLRALASRLERGGV